MSSSPLQCTRYAWSMPSVSFMFDLAGYCRIVMTPINFVSFLVSLVLVDIHYTRRRLHTHAESPSRLPSWLHDLLYRRHPYEDLRGQSSEIHEPWYYHSKQKKLMRMEAEDAFRLRGTVLVGLAVALAAGTAAALYSLKILLSWLWV
ncbi:hypothetical protein CCM_06677 [Cordyceps militaris CM01]|uniref:Uncharacterized protein n=2 Tax=Cordyceps militaris TaxID=73501 RepID=G3JN76_CORMM|nr:uncharacterized protein CCM_06677 [Cordyceps militaris CM01]ATY63220.1 hypothetical protein A9K55_008225 [Cordyceps militaris]EGX90258.1 hypothetical protein CCM_06677 [Cordyceps militaris CM01]